MAEATGSIASLQRRAADLEQHIQQRDAAVAHLEAQAIEKIRLLEDQLSQAHLERAAQETKRVEEARRLEDLRLDAERKLQHLTTEYTTFHQNKQPKTSIITSPNQKDKVRT